MEQHSSPYYTLSFIILSLFFQQSLCQQAYIDNQQLDCLKSSSETKGFVCNSSDIVSCDSFLTFRSTTNYDTPESIGKLLDSSASDIAWLNRFVSTNYKIPHNSLVIVPITCRCMGSMYQHNSGYTTVKGSETYFVIANDTFQGLTTCQAIAGQNFYDFNVLRTGMNLMVPMRCACPSEKQRENGVIALTVYMVTWRDTVVSIAKAFGVRSKSLLDANKLSDNGIIFPFTPLLVPLEDDSCEMNTRFSFCSKSCNSQYSALRPTDCKSPKSLVTLTGIGSGIAFLFLVLGGYRVYRFLKKRRYKLTKAKFFKQNGGILLQQKLYENDRRIKIFTQEELEKATDNYSRNRFLGQGGYGTVYKGMLKDGTTVAVKRSKQIETNWINQFINEVAILSQINHRNVVKLLGCCLETKFPLLVYEFVPNGTLSYHIHKQDSILSPPLSWETRLRIASEIAGAISYMHSAASTPIFHRDIKSMNILLDDNYSAKVSDFGTSRFVPCDRSHLTTRVQGTLGYIDPEFFRSNQYTEKSDVYSFGVLMVELLTGKTPFTFAKDGEGGNLLEYFISLENDNQLVEIVDITGHNEENLEVVHAIAKLGIKCLRLNGKKRPTMKQVYLEIEGLRKSSGCSHIVEDNQSTSISSVHSGSNNYEYLTDESIISIDLEAR